MKVNLNALPKLIMFLSLSPFSTSLAGSTASSEEAISISEAHPKKFFKKDTKKATWLTSAICGTRQEPELFTILFVFSQTGYDCAKFTKDLIEKDFPRDLVPKGESCGLSSYCENIKKNPDSQVTDLLQQKPLRDSPYFMVKTSEHPKIFLKADRRLPGDPFGIKWCKTKAASIPNSTNCIERKS